MKKVLRGNFSNKNTLNDLSGKEWMKLTSSIHDLDESKFDHILDEYLKELKSTSYPTKGLNSIAHEIRSKHPSPKPPQLFIELISFLSKENEVVLDPFVGSGSSLIASTLLNRKGIGIDLNERFKQLYVEACKSLNIQQETYLIGNASKEQTYSDIKDKVDLIVCDPPYGNMMSRKKTGTVKYEKGENPTPFTNGEEDLGNMELSHFFPELKKCIAASANLLKPGGYIVVFMKDLQPTKAYHGMLHADTVKVISSIDNIHYRGMKIWFNKSAKLFPYGYPFSYVSNQMHQFILIFRKDR